jgi:diamine N-acetyltransferase
MTPHFFAASKDDIEQILQLQEAFYAIDSYDFDRATAMEALRFFINDANYGKLWLIMVNGQLAGYAALTLGYSFEFKGRDAFLDELYLMPEYRGNDIGARAVDFVTEQAKAMGVKAIHLEVEINNDRGISLYRRYGFQDHRRMLMTRWV